MAVWKYNGRLIELKDLRRELLKAGEDQVDAAVVFAAKELNRIIDRLNATTSNRGAQANAASKNPVRGASRYNQPLRTAKVVITKKKTGKGGFSYRVAVEHRSHRGVNIFDLLDAGSPDKSGEQTFPVYDGRKTTVAGRGAPKISSAPVRLGKPLFFVTLDHVKGFPPRNYYQHVSDKVRRKFPFFRNSIFKVGGKRA